MRELIDVTASDQSIAKSFQVHEDKVHFVPSQYRVLGGLLQSLNIKFGNFLEKLLDLIIHEDSFVSRHPKSGTRLRLKFSAETDARIDSYITSRQLPASADQCDDEFDALLEDIVSIENDGGSEKHSLRKDVDVLFTDREGKFVYVEVKYNDDHDTGKFVDINRKFLKTFAGLVNELEVSDLNQLLPILYYFNPRKRWGPIYVPTSHICRGSELFERYFESEYRDVDKYLREIGDDAEIRKLFDSMYKRIMMRSVNGILGL